MSTDFSIYVGAFVKLTGQINKDPIILGPASHWGCQNCADADDNPREAKRREGMQFCQVCGGPLSHVNYTNMMDDCLGNIMYECPNLPIHAAVESIGEYISLDLEDTWEAILVKDPSCQVATPDIGFYDSYCDNDCKDDWGKRSASQAIRHIEDTHCHDLGMLKTYYNKVEVVYGVIHQCY